MNRKKVFSTVGLMLQAEAALLLLPMLCALIYREKCIWSLAASAAIALGVGTLLRCFCKPTSDVIYAREGFVTVAMTWLALSAAGALPFWISGEIPSYIDAFFETVSGFTTTGASILNDVEAMSHGLLFWRSFTHWIGGMGILVFVMAIVDDANDRSMHILRAEMPGPVIGKLLPRVKDTASVLYKIYIGMTLLLIALLLAGGMSPFDSLLHAFGTAGTGGFGIKADSFAGYNPYLQWVTTIFMFLFGVNFNLYYLLLIRRFRAALQSSEVWYYLAIVLGSILLITLNIMPMYDTFTESLRHSAFQVSSIITTTGYATTNFDIWPEFSKSILLILMLVGACAGSTGGGLKVSRVVILVKVVRKEFRHLLHPRSVNTIMFEGKRVSSSTVKSVSNYFAVYCMCMVVIYLLLSLDGFGMGTNISATFSCFNNIGPGFASVGPASSYAGYSPFSTFLLSLAMLLGRLEIFPLLLTLSPATWAKK